MMLYPEIDIDVSPVRLVLLKSFEPSFSLKVVILLIPVLNCTDILGNKTNNTVWSVGYIDVRGW